jgi:MarR family transcriptional regulator, lower aerobic nicotinate degradation pathway regulator
MPKDDRRIYEKPGHLIRRLHQISLALFMDETREFDITPVQYSAILAIDNHPGIDQTALCNIIAFDRSTIGDVMGRLERKKLVKRTPGAQDRRTKLLYLTPAGRKLIDNIESAVQRTQKRILEPLTMGERVVLMRMLKKLVHLNNEHSRAPLRINENRKRRTRSAQLDRAPQLRPEPRRANGKRVGA